MPDAHRSRLPLYMVYFPFRAKWVVVIYHDAAIRRWIFNQRHFHSTIVIITEFDTAHHQPPSMAIRDISACR